MEAFLPHSLFLQLAAMLVCSRGDAANMLACIPSPTKGFPIKSVHDLSAGLVLASTDPVWSLI